MREHELEPVPGLPENLPAGERLLWQGRPDWKTFCVQAMHVRALAVYFGILAVWQGVSALYDGAGIGAGIIAAAWLVGLGSLLIAMLALFSWQVGRSTLYTITNQRVVMRFGLALPMTVNLPFKVVESAALRTHKNDFGDVTLSLTKGSKPSYLIMWPHVRPWRYARPEPMIRCVADAEAVALTLSGALARFNGQQVAQAAVVANDGVEPSVTHRPAELATATR